MRGRCWRMARTCWCPSSWMAKTPGNITIRTAGRSCANCTAASPKSSDLDALTVSEALKFDQPRPLDHIFPGSWINANFDVWIGARGGQQGLGVSAARARRSTTKPRTASRKTSGALACEELLIAEGSDWCWWYGPEHDSDNRRGIRPAVSAAPVQCLSRAGSRAAGGSVAPDSDECSRAIFTSLRRIRSTR